MTFVTLKFKNKRYGIETYLNHIFKKPYEVKLSAYHLIKTEKMKPDEAFISYLHEAIEVVKERAKIRGVWNEDFEKTLRSFRKAKTWMQLKEKIKQAGNEDAKELFKKFFYNYFRRIKDSAPRRISSLYKFFKE